MTELDVISHCCAGFPFPGLHKQTHTCLRLVWRGAGLDTVLLSSPVLGVEWGQGIGITWSCPWIANPAHSTFLGASVCSNSALQDGHWSVSAAEIRGNHLLEVCSVLELGEAKLAVHSNLLGHCLGSQGWIILSIILSLSASCWMVTAFSVGGSACWGKELTVAEAVGSGFGGTQGWAYLHGAPRNPLWHKPWKELVSRVSWVFQPKQNFPKMHSNGKWSTEQGCCDGGEAFWLL